MTQASTEKSGSAGGIQQQNPGLPTKDEVVKFMSELFGGLKNARGPHCGQPVTMKTPCKHFFHLDPDGITFNIGAPIERKFGFKDGALKWSMPDHAYDMPEKHRDKFYKKYPDELIGDSKFTLAVFCDMIFDLILINHDQQIDGCPS